MRDRRGLRKRRIVRAAVCALVGAALTVAVSWACAVWYPLPDAAARELPLRWRARVPGHWPERPRESLAYVVRGRTTVESWHEEGGGPEGTIYGVLIVRAGLPMRALERRYVVEWDRSKRASAGTSSSAGELRLPEWVPRRWVRDDTLPAWPVWMGFVADAAVLGAGVYAAWAAPGAVVRRRRLGRGQCRWCGYDMSGSVGVCPECGAGYGPDGRGLRPAGRGEKP